MKKTLYFLLVLAAVLAWRDWAQREIVHPPGILVREAPKQYAIDDPGPIMLDGYRLSRRAGFEIRARVLSRENYHWGSESDLSPMDLALGWGAMSDQQNLDRIAISQSGRWYYTRYEYPAPLADGEIITHSGNVHMVPSSGRVRKQLKKVRKGDVVQLKGYLVDVDHESGFYWRTSLRRDDTGGGSCEILYVVAAEIEGRG